MNHSRQERQQFLAEAEGHLRSALDLLDSAAAPAHIGAHVDLAIHQLQTELDAARETSPRTACQP